MAYGLRVYFRWHLEGLEYIPKDAAALVASNHLSYLDGLAVAYGVHRAGRRPRFLTKAGLFNVPVIGAALKAIGQIPVNRGTRDAPQSLDNADAALKAGEVVVVFPEGTTSTAPDLAMGKAKTGTARLALQSGMDVVPCDVGWPVDLDQAPGCAPAAPAGRLGAIRPADLVQGI